MKFSRCFLFVSLLSSVCLAEERKPEIQRIDADLALIYPVSKGQPAPFPGVLLSPAAAVKLVTEYAIFEDRVKIEVDSAVSIARAKSMFEMKEQEAQCNAARSIRDAQLHSRDSRIEILEKDLKEKQSEIDNLKQSSPSRVVWFGLGFASAMIFTIATAYAVGQVAN
jgi:hypothetical protein